MRWTLYKPIVILYENAHSDYIISWKSHNEVIGHLSTAGSYVEIHPHYIHYMVRCFCVDRGLYNNDMEMLIWMQVILYSLMHRHSHRLNIQCLQASFSTRKLSYYYSLLLDLRLVHQKCHIKLR